MGADRQRIIVVGAGGHGHVVVDVLQSQADAGRPFEVVAVLDDRVALHGSIVGGIAVAGDRSLIESIPHDGVIVAIGDNATRRRVHDELVARGELLIAAAHPASVISRQAAIESGVVVCAGAVVGPLARIGSGAIINTGARVDHHCSIDRFVHVAPGATLAGTVTIGEETLIGMGAVVLPGVTIGARAVIGAGTVVLADVTDGLTLVGVPGRVTPKKAAR